MQYSRRDFFLLQWKIAQIIMIQKPGKPAELTESYPAPYPLETI